ncbi:MAG: CHAT domain-containing protein, partial [Pseudonocardiaceae bacterium]
LAAVQAHAPHLSHLVRVIVAYWNWIAASQGLERHDDRAILWSIHAVIPLARTGYHDLATIGVGTLARILDRQLAEGTNVDQHELGPAIWAMAETVFAQLRESGWWSARECLSMLLAHWSRQETREGDERAVITMTLLKGPGVAGALARPGPAPHDREIATAIAQLGADRWAEPTTALQDVILTSYLHSDEREPGATAEQRRANLRRRAQNADVARLMAGASAAPILHGLDEIRAALPDDAVLLTVCHSAAMHAAKDSLHMVLVPRQGSPCVASVDTLHGAKNYVHTIQDPDTVEVRVVHSRTARLMTYVRRSLLEDPLHRDVSRDGALALRLVARQLQLNEGLGKPLTRATGGCHTRLIFWPHESLYFVPLQLLPFRDGILADHFTVTVVPSVECLFPRSDTIILRSGVTAIACATGGLPAGLPEEPSLHQQAERIADLFNTRPLTGDDATPAAALKALGTTRYLHLAAHGAQDVDAPLFARVYLAGGALHAHEILQRDLRETELVTLSACESALLRYDFLDNLHGLAPAFLRAGARAVIGALWPISPEAAETFFTQLYAHLANGGTRVDAFRFAQNQARARHPNYRDWGAFTYFGS